MGVMGCSKMGCDNIMCEYYVPSVGYICYECISDFKDTHNGFEGELDLIDALGLYVDTDKESCIVRVEKLIDMDKFFKDHFIE